MLETKHQKHDIQGLAIGTLLRKTKSAEVASRVEDPTPPEKKG